MREEPRLHWREYVRSLWFMPAVFVVSALAAGLLLSQVEVGDDSVLEPLLFRGDAEAARQLLTVVAGTMITVTGLVFVLTVVALQIASTQFSPRLLRSFLQDIGTRLVLSVFVATFAYSLGGLFDVGRRSGDEADFVPQIAVTGSLLLALISVGMLVYYIQHITNSIRIDAVMQGVERATLRAVGEQHPRRCAGAAPAPPLPEPPETAMLVPVGRSGYVQAFDVDTVAAVARSGDSTIRIRPQVGHHLVKGDALAWVWPSDGPPHGGRADVGTALNRAVTITVERRPETDIGFGIRQLVDIALRALAPGLHDPYTAVQAVQHLSVVMAELAAVATDPRRIEDADGTVRVVVPVPDFALFLDTVCSNLRRSAADEPRVLVALLRLLETVAASDTTDDRRALVDLHAEWILAAAESAIGTDHDVQPVRDMAAAARYAARHGVPAHR